MSGFPSLQPSMTIQATLDPPISVGSASRGTALAVVPMTGGNVKSESGFSPALNAEFVGTGNDYIHNDPSGKHMRLNAHAVVQDKESGAMVYLNYSGVVDITPELGAILQGQEDAKSTDFGGSFIEMRFETGDQRLKALETMTFVAAGRFICEHGKPVVVEYKLSKVVKGGN